ncbi:hypothetical protein V4F39_18235 [Aquincola sp. MAHUQ-54]|uniref:Uncharacterized protein n=1 Tax=Aquincola agrisoli TaxID=3119538 RepID=A0AAW9QKD3_9BURK
MTVEVLLGALGALLALVLPLALARWLLGRRGRAPRRRDATIRR